ncbi:MAG: ATP-binding protein [candidate division Zixibacteria bacterium]|nr:ATP-binding protein [candidate division Zixibacteria bacterium]
MERYSLKYPSIPASEDLMLDDLDTLLDRLKLGREMKHKIMLVVSEAYTNAYLHGNQENPATTIKIDLTVNETEITVDISDEGKEREGLVNIENKKPAALFGENGRGIDLMKHYADLVRFERGAKGGLKVITVFFRLNKNEVKI